MRKADSVIAKQGFKAVFSALDSDDARRFIEILTGKPYDYTELRQLWIDANADDLTNEEAIAKFLNTPIPTDWTPKNPIAASAAKGKPAPIRRPAYAPSAAIGAAAMA